MIRLLLAAAIAMASSLAGTRVLIWWLTRLQIGQPIRDDGPRGHSTKAGTPTMGGLAIVGGALLGYILSDLYRGIYTRSGIFVMLAIIGGGAVGLMDDWIKVVRERSLGLNKRAKMLGLLVVAGSFAILMLEHAPVHTQLSFTRFDQPGLELGSTLWAIWAVLLIIGSANAVNLTDGLDGLAAGAGTFCFGAYTVMAFWQFRYPETYDVAHALDLAVVAAAMAGGCLGFLWWNAARPGSSWVIRARWRSAPVLRPWRSRPTPTCCCRSWPGCSWPRPFRSSSRSEASACWVAGGCSQWPRSTTTSSFGAGRRPP